MYIFIYIYTHIYIDLYLLPSALLYQVTDTQPAAKGTAAQQQLPFLSCRY